jgi:hypothetical protein
MPRIIPIGGGGGGALTANVKADGAVTEGDLVSRTGVGTAGRGVALDPFELVGTSLNNSATGVILDVLEFNRVLMLHSLGSNNRTTHYRLMDHGLNEIALGTGTLNTGANARGDAFTWNEANSSGLRFRSSNNPDALQVYHFHVDTASTVAVTQLTAGVNYTAPSSAGSGNDFYAAVPTATPGRWVWVSFDPSGSPQIQACVIDFDDTGVTGQGAWTTIDNTVGTNPLAGGAGTVGWDATTGTGIVTYYSQGGAARTIHYIAFSASGTTISVGNRIDDPAPVAEQFQGASSPVYDPVNGTWWGFLYSSTNTLYVMVMDRTGNTISSTVGAYDTGHANTGAENIMGWHTGYDATNGRVWVFGSAFSEPQVFFGTPQADSTTNPVVSAGVAVANFSADYGLSVSGLWRINSAEWFRPVASWGRRYVRVGAFNPGNDEPAIYMYDPATNSVAGLASAFAGIAGNSAADGQPLTVNYGTTETGGLFAGNSVGDRVRIGADGGAYVDNSGGVLVGIAQDAAGTLIIGGGESFGQLKAEE